jgi:uncharacterized peroxidase-related enzyme
MSFLSSIPDANLFQVLQAYPDFARPILAVHEVVMRGPSPLSVGERELIAAYVSGRNDCAYCYGVHTATAEAFGVPVGLLTAALADLDTAPVEDRMKPVLHYVGKLTAAPAKMSEADAQAVYDAGWDERALHDAVLVCATFNFMNRVVDGLGLGADPRRFTAIGDRLKQGGYVSIARALD